MMLSTALVLLASVPGLSGSGWLWEDLQPLCSSVSEREILLEWVLLLAVTTHVFIKRDVEILVSFYP